MVQIALQNSGGQIGLLRWFHGTPFGHQYDWKYLGHLSDIVRRHLSCSVKLVFTFYVIRNNKHISDIK